MQWPPAITGVIHAGAHLAEEYSAYEEHGVAHSLWIEPQWRCCANIRRRIGHHPGVDVRNVALGADATARRLHLASNGQSSSLLPPKRHISVHPHVHFSGASEWVTVQTLDALTFDRSLYQLLVLDLQGYELEALRGAELTLRSLSWVCSEVARVELYEGQPLVGELREWMAARSWELISEEWWPGSDEGECLWRRT